ncbi:hypothetical protein H5410_002995 [Solanum commersonii]|uniref:Uncharacterized protein n=1 Tax=Solanum commersonii TaxID=4109 RepID=A0A9J6B3G8_SOLCO|nr:hypothetical protein H5410_002995 [Solanum commersonii]
MVRPVQGPILPTLTHVKPPFSQKPFTPYPIYRKLVNSQVAKPNRFTGNGLGRRLNVAEMDEKRAKGLCFFCDDKYVVGHKCRSNKQFFLVEREDEELVKEEVVQDQIQEDNEEVDEFMTISLQAFTGVTGYHTIRVTGYHEKKPLQVLIDTRSTHNFIDQEVPRGRCKQVQWLNTLGRILFDFKSRTIEFRYQGKKHVLRGVSNQLKSARAKSINNVKRIGCSATTFMLTMNPTTLPPHRASFDHRIPLVESANAVNKRPYRYRGVKKDIIEKLVHEMIDQEVIQHGTSPNASQLYWLAKRMCLKICVVDHSTQLVGIADTLSDPSFCQFHRLLALAFKDLRDFESSAI